MSGFEAINEVTELTENLTDVVKDVAENVGDFARDAMEHFNEQGIKDLQEGNLDGAIDNSDLASSDKEGLKEVAETFDLEKKSLFTAGAKVIGGKTGYTGEAGNCLILLDQDESGKHYISIVMGADSKPLLYEDMTLAGIFLGNLFYLFQFHIPGQQMSLILYGLFSGIFLGGWILALAEIADVFPIFFRRIKLAEGFVPVIFSISLGKCLGSLFFYYFCQQ